MIKIGFVCTNYNNSTYTRAAVESLNAAASRHDLRVAVVDNASGDRDRASLRELAREFPNVELVLSPNNVGYFPGLNLGIRHLRTTWPEISHIVVGNNDLVFAEDFVDAIQDGANIFGRWAVVAPDLVTSDGVHQNPHVLFPISKTRRLVWRLYYASFQAAVAVRYAARITKRFSVRYENATGSQLYRQAGPVEQGYGACYILGPVFFQHFSRLYAPTFLMQEEYFLSEQLKSIGQMTYYDPRFVVHHVGHATTHTLPSRKHWHYSHQAYCEYRRYQAMPYDEKHSMIVNATRAKR